jgi:hypothetical protein
MNRAMRLPLSPGLAAAAFLAAGALASRAGDAVVPGALTVEPPTLHCLGFEWAIEGDDNRNAAVGVAFRKAGDPDWRPAMPLLRLGGEKVGGKAGWSEYVVPRMFAGSVFDLEPGAEYEARLSMSDPDGGNAERVVRARTKAEPRRPEGGRELHVYPDGFSGARAAPAFANLQAALDAARPGDQVLLHAGVYRGSWTLSRGGTAERPLVVRGAGDGEAVIEGNRSRQVVDLHKADHVAFEDLVFRDPGAGDGGHTADGVVLLAGNVSQGVVPGCKGLVVRRCRFEDFGVGVMAAEARCEGFVITDNRFLGRQDWLAPKEAPDGVYTNYSYVAVWVAGAGHDVARNFIRGFRDGVNVAAGWKGRDFTPAAKNVSIDFYDNVITEVGDDFLETDNGTHNLRVMRNLCLNTQTCGMSAQPVFGGPAYFIRNVLCHGPRGVALKFNVHPAGLVVWHNTFCIAWRNAIPWSNGHFRNNLFLGGGFEAGTLTSYSTLDHDGFAPGPIRWNGKEYAEVEELAKATELETRGVRVAGPEILQNVPPPAGKARACAPGEVDFRLRAGTPAVDAGCALPNVNDGFGGRAPDLGALELGRPLPHYGPRP